MSNLLPIPYEVRPVRAKDWIDFRCQWCGQCCRNIEDAVMVESLDAYRIAKHLRNNGHPEMNTGAFYLEYTHAVMLTAGFPVMMLNTAGSEQACVFLKDNRCAIYPVRPRICRHYPFSVEPGGRGRDFIWVLCKDKPFHLTGGRVLVKDWINQNFPREEREFLKREYGFYTRLGKILRGMDEETREHCLRQIVFFWYINYELDEPFQPQHERNIDALLERLAQMARE